MKKCALILVTLYGFSLSAMRPYRKRPVAVPVAYLCVLGLRSRVKILMKMCVHCSLKQLERELLRRVKDLFEREKNHS